MHGLKFAFRTLAKTPFVSGVAIISLALGIGANTAIFSLFDQMLLKTLPAQEVDRLVNFSAPGPKPGSTSCGNAGSCEEVFSYPMFKDLEEQSTSFSDIAAHVGFGANLAQDGLTTNGAGIFVSGSYFPTLGMQPVLGRLIGPADDERFGEHPVAMLSHRYWENHLGADRSVLNKTLVVNGIPLTIIGVAPVGFDGTTIGSQYEVFVPMTMRSQLNPWFDNFENRRAYWAYVFGRLAPGVTLEQADAEINALYNGIVNDVEVPLQDQMTAETMDRFRSKPLLLEAGDRGQSSLHEDATTPLALLLGITAVVLLIACANIANLLLARGANRAQEMAIRGSIGASRGQMLRQLLNESVLLAVLGGVASLAVAWWTLTGIASMLPPEAANTIEIGLQPRMIAFTAVLSLLTGLVFGMYPSLHSTRTDLVAMLKANLGQPANARAAQRFRTTLVTGQIALSMALLGAAGLFIKSLVNVSQIDLGLDPENIIGFGVSPELNGYEPERTAALFVRIEEELAAIPGVTGVTAARVQLLAGNNWGTSVSVEGFEWAPGVDANSRYNEVGPHYFSTTGMALIAGREFTESDGDGAPLVAVVNEAFTRKFELDGAQAVGKYMANGGAGEDELDIQIVGVVQDAKYSSVTQDVPPLFFMPYRQNGSIGSMTFYVRTELEEEEILAAIPPLVSRLDGQLPVEDLKTLVQQINENTAPDRVIGILATAFAILATILAAIGLYGVLAYSVAQRTREIGLRMALGARGANVRGMVLKQVGRMTAVGAVFGIALAVFLGRAAESILFEVEGVDGVVLVAVTVVLALVAMGAGYLPAARASKVDPMNALRYE